MLAPAQSHRFDNADGCIRCWTLIKRAVLTHDALPGEKLSSLVSGIDVIRDIEEAYGYTEVRAPRFIPTPRDVSNMLPALSWMCWLKQQQGTGGRDFKLLICRARGVSWWKLSQRFGRSERTLERWQDGAIAAVYSKFDLEIWSRDPGQ